MMSKPNRLARGGGVGEGRCAADSLKSDTVTPSSLMPRLMVRRLRQPRHPYVPRRVPPAQLIYKNRAADLWACHRSQQHFLVLDHHEGSCRRLAVDPGFYLAGSPSQAAREPSDLTVSRRRLNFNTTIPSPDEKAPYVDIKSTGVPPHRVRHLTPSSGLSGHN